MRILFGLRIVAILIFCLTLYSCGGGGGGAGNGVAASGSVSAYVSKGPLTDSECSLYTANNVKLAGPVKSVAGTVKFPKALPAGFSGITYVECLGGTYTDEATGQTQMLESLRGGNNVTDGGQVVVTPLTELAMRKAKVDLSDLPDQARKVAEAFGLASVDILNTKPTDVNTRAAADTSADQYGSILATISQLSSAATVGSSTSINGLITEFEKNLNGNRFNTDVAQALSQAAVDLQQTSAVKTNILSEPPTPPMTAIAGTLGNDNTLSSEPSTVTVAQPVGAQYSTPTAMSWTKLRYNQSATVSISGSFTDGGSQMKASIADVPCTTRSASGTRVVFNCLVSNDRTIANARIKIFGNIPPVSQYYYSSVPIASPPIIVSNVSPVQLTRSAQGPSNRTLIGTGFYDGLTVSMNNVQCKSRGSVNAAGTNISGIDCSNIRLPPSGDSVAVAVAGASKPSTGNTLSIGISLVDPPTAAFNGWSNGNTLICAFGSACQNTVSVSNCGVDAAPTYSIATPDQALASVNARTGAVALNQITATPIAVTATQGEVPGLCLASSTTYQLTITTDTAGTVSFATPTALIWNGAAQTVSNSAVATCSKGGNYKPSITYTTSDSTNAPVDRDGQVTVKRAGSYSISANVTASGNCVAGSGSYTLTMNKATPTLSFASPSKTITYGDAGAALASPALNGVPLGTKGVVTYSCTSYRNTRTPADAVGCSINNSGLLNVSVPGTGTVVATFSGDENYNAVVGSLAPSYRLTVDKATPILTFEGGLTQTNKISTDGPFAIVANLAAPATIASQAPGVSYSSSGLTGVTVHPVTGTVTLTSSPSLAGTATITAATAENAYFKAASASYSAVISSAPQIPIYYKRVQVYVEPDLLINQTLAEIRNNFAGYIDDLNVILAKNTHLRLTFDPNDVRTDQYSNIVSCGDNPLNENFTIDINIFKSSLSYSNGGYVTCDGFRLNRKVISGLEWSKFYSRTEIRDSTLPMLQPGYDDYYLRQLTTLAHEVAHVMGAGFGEYYSLNMDDLTGELPNLKILLFDQDNFYWKKRRNIEKDPLLARNSYPTGKAILDGAKFSNLTAKIINTTLENRGTFDSSYAFLRSKWKKSYQPVNIRVIDDADGTPISNCEVRSYGQEAINGVYLRERKITDSSGAATLDIKSELDGTYLRRFMLFKASCNGYAPVGDAISKFDLEARYLNDGGQANDFQFNGTITLRAIRR